MKARVLFFMLLAAVSGCGTQPVKKQTSGVAMEEQQAPQVETDPYVLFCSELVEQFNNKNTDGIKALFDRDILVRNALAGTKLQPATRNALSIGLKIGMSTKLEELVQGVTVNEYWYSIDTQKRNRCVVHSELSTDYGMSIIEFKLAKRNDLVVVADWYDYVSNQRMTVSVREALFALVKEQGTFLPNEEALKNLREFKKSLAAGDVESALSTYQSIGRDSPLKKILILLLAIEAANYGEHYMTIMAEYDAMTSAEEKGLLLVDYYVLNGEPQKAIDVVDSIEKKIVKDAVFSLLRASVYQADKQNDRYIHHIYEAISTGITYEDIYWSLLDFFIQEDMHSDSILVLNILMETFGYSFAKSSFENLPEYERFIASSEFSEWAKAL